MWWYNKRMNIGDIAPAFTLSDQNGSTHSLLDYRGKFVLLYFYPKDDTPGCTKEACTIRDSYSIFEEKNIVVLGVSADSIESHKKFEEKYGLPFTLLSDPDKVVRKLYGVTGRDSFLINPMGMIKKVYRKVTPVEHAGEVLIDVSL